MPTKHEQANRMRYYVTTIRSARSPEKWFEWVIPAASLKDARKAAFRAYAGPDWIAQKDTRWYPDESSWPNVSPL